jgi:hypothetical protein
VLKANHFNAPKINAHREAENGDDDSTSHWDIETRDSNLLGWDQVRIVGNMIGRGLARPNAPDAGVNLPNNSKQSVKA